MDKLTFQLGRWFGVPLIMHWTFTIFALFILLFNPTFAPIYLMVFASVVLHEYGHCLMAKKYNLEVKQIFLMPIGGMAQIDLAEVTPKEELLVTLAGPAVNVVLGILAFIVWGWLTHFSITPPEALAFFIVVQVVLLVFNSLPAFPLDGGRIFRAICSMLMNHRVGTLVAVRVSQMTCLVVGTFFVLNMSFWIPLIMVLVMLAAQGELWMLNKPESEDTASQNGNSLI